MDIEKYVRLRHLRGRSIRFLSVFSIITVIIVTSMLALPGITESREASCGLTEHIHGEDCYGVVAELACIYADEERASAEITEIEVQHETTTKENETIEEISSEAVADGKVSASENPTAETSEITSEVSVLSEELTVEEPDSSVTEEFFSEEKTTFEEQITEADTTDSADETTSYETIAADVTSEQISTVTSSESEHIHTDECYIYGNKLLCSISEHTHTEDCYPDSEKVTEETQSADNALENDVTSVDSSLSEADKDQVKYINELIEALPSVDEFYNELDRFYEADDTDGEAGYILDIQNRTITAYCSYQGIEELQEYIIGTEKMFLLLDVFRNMPQPYTTGTSSAVTFNYINQGWSAVAPIVIYGGSANDKITSGSSLNQYWHGIVVDYNSAKDYYYVSEKYVGGSASSASIVRSLKATTSKGFVIFIWMADSGATALQRTAAQVASNVAIGDLVEVSVDPTTLSSGYKSSGYGTVTFKEYVEPEPDEPFVPDTGDEVETKLDSTDPLWYTHSAEASDSQIISGGGKFVSADGNVITTKTINGTSEENVFDITLTVQTNESFELVLSEPDMAVVIVMDISNTMNNTVGYQSYRGDPTRYDAAVAAAEQFIRSFARNTQGISKIGFVAFNTHAHKIFDLTPCSAEKDAQGVESIISTMKSDTEAIIDNYVSDDWERFTNVEAGLKMGYDMLAESSNANKYIVFLSDGFPTTYLDNDTSKNTDDTYYGYNTYTPSGTKGADGVFYDYVTGYYCSYGTSYSDKASIKARKMATQIKELGAEIFSIGVDIGTQTIEGYDGRVGLSVIDRTSTTYEIGDAKSKEAYQNWLCNSIGSGHYYSSDSSDALNEAFEKVFEEIQEINENSSKTVWSATDPMPVYDEEPSIVGFVHFFDKDGNVVESPSNPEALVGTHIEGGENNATHSDHVIFWDLKKSGYTTHPDAVDPTVTHYHYKLKYRVRLVNEKVGSEAFKEHFEYNTNGDAYLEYKNIVAVDGDESISDAKYVSFSHPSVQGYMVPLSFNKVNSFGTALPGAEFSLTHDDALCTKCHGDNTAITNGTAHDANYVSAEEGGDPHLEHVIGPFKATSDSNGNVTFKEEIPSGHIYILSETVIPEGHKSNGSRYSLAAFYDTVTVTEIKSDNTVVRWKLDGSDTVTNPSDQVLPETGGTGVYYLYIIGGLLICMSSVSLLCLYKNDRERRRRCSKR